MREFKYLLVHLAILTFLCPASVTQGGTREDLKPGADLRDPVVDALDGEPRGVAAQYLDQGRLLEQRSDLDGAIDAYRRAVAGFPRSAETHFALGKALLEAGSLHDALPSLTFAIRLDPGHTGALYERARLCLRLGLHGQALKDLDRLIGISPGVADYHYQRARAFMKLDSVHEAFRDFLRAHELDARYPRPTLHGQDKPAGGKPAVATIPRATRHAQPHA